MKVKGITIFQLAEIVAVISAKEYKNGVVFKRYPERVGSWVHFTLRTVDGRSLGARRSHTGRRLASACWHAHRDVMQAIFDRYPDAELVSAFARYIGRDGFMSNFPATGNINIGSQANPMLMDEACDCAS